MQPNTDEPTFDIFDNFTDLNLGDHFSMIYDPGEHAGEVLSFQGSVKEKNDMYLAINYTYQNEWSHGHSVCYGVIQLDLSHREVIRYSLCDKYDDCFEISADTIFETFNQCCNPAFIKCEMWYSDNEPHHEYYDQAEWADQTEYGDSESYHEYYDQTECNAFIGG
jgi:hypothetical protein